MSILSFHEQQFRLAIRDIIAGVSGVKNVYATQRLISDINALRQSFTDAATSTLTGWEISLRRMIPTTATFQGGGISGTIIMDYFFDVVWWRAVNDAAESERVVVNTTIEVIDALLNASELTGATLERENPIVSDVNFEYRVFAGVLCHRVSMVVNPQEELL